MEIISNKHNPLAPFAGLIAHNIANRNGAPVTSPLVRLHDILAQSNSSDDVVAFMPLRKRAMGRA